MKVIFLKDVPKIGKKDDVKEVSDGFAQNALLPKGLAKIATQKEIDALSARKESFKKAEQQAEQNMKDSVEILKKEKINISITANDQGHLFSKFKIEQLKKVFKEKNIDFDTKFIVPFEIKETGTYSIKIKTPQFTDTFEIEIKAL